MKHDKNKSGGNTTDTGNSGKVYCSCDVGYENNSIAIGVIWQVTRSRNKCSKYDQPHTDETLGFGHRENNQKNKVSFLI